MLANGVSIDAPAAITDLMCDVYDAKNPACQGLCGPGTSPDACRPCPDPPDVDVVACQATMPCPNPPDRRVLHCYPNRLPAGVLLARIIQVDSATDGVIITISLGSKHGIDDHWHGTVLAGETDDALEHGEITWIRIARLASKGLVHLTADQVEHNQHVRVTR